MITACILLTILVVILYLCNVPKTLSAEDQEYILKMLDEISFDIDTLRDHPSFREEIRTIIGIQDAVFTRAPDIKLIPYGQEREPEHLYKLGHGYCCDRARTMDKAMRLAGFQSRYVSLYRKHPDYSFWQSLLTTKASDYECHSHAVIEVKTSKGWMAVETRSRWVGVTGNLEVYDLERLKMLNDPLKHAWAPMNQEGPYKFFAFPFYTLHGLYSRHGKFYPPFIKFLPNVNWREALENLKG